MTALIQAGGGVCRHNTSLSTGVAQRLGFSARQIVFGYQGKYAGHTVTVVDTRGGGFYIGRGASTSWWVVDASIGRAMPFSDYMRSSSDPIVNIKYYSESGQAWKPLVR